MKSQATMSAVLDALVSTGGNITESMKACGCDPSLFWKWMLASNQQTDERYFLPWGGGDPQWFHIHYQTARKRSTVLMEGNLRAVVTSGRVERQIVFNGELQFERDRRFIGWTDQEMLDLGFKVSQRYVRDELGRAIPATYSEPAPAHLLIRGAAAYLPQWQDHRSVDANISHSGVLTIHRRSAPPIVPAPVQQAVKQIAEQAALEDDAAMVEDDAVEAPDAAPEMAEPEMAETAPANERPDIAALRRQVEERNARVAAMGKSPAPQQPGTYQTLAMRGDPRVAGAAPTRADDPADHVTKPGGDVIPGGHRVA